MQDLSAIWDSRDPAGSLRKYADALNEHARATFLESGTHVQLFFLLKTDGLGAVVPVMEKVEKQQLAEVLRKHIAAENIYGVVHIVEAWAYLPGKKNDHTMKQLVQGEMRVSDLKAGDRTEALVLHASSREGLSSLSVHPIIRADGKVTLAEVIQIDDPAGGLFGRLFA